MLIAHRAIAVALALASDAPPTEFRIFAAGWNDTSNGRFLFDDKAAEAVLTAYAEQGNDLPLDYDHAMLDDAPRDPASAARAAGWFNLEVRSGELWAVNVRWTPPAAEALGQKEWRYYSPAFKVEPKSSRVTKLVNVALTNLPATKNMEPLVAAGARDRRTKVKQDVVDVAGRVIGSATSLSMSLAELSDAICHELCELFGGYCYVCELYDDHVIFMLGERCMSVAYAVKADSSVELVGEAFEVERTYTEVPGGVRVGPVTTEASAARGENDTMLPKHILIALGLREDAPEVEALGAITRSQEATREVIRLTGKATMAEALGVLQAWRASHERVEALGAELAGIKKSQADTEIKLALDKATSEGRLPPAARPQVEALYASHGAAAVTAMLAALPVQVQLGGAPPVPVPGGNTVTLSAEEAKVAELLGVPRDKVLEAKRLASG